MKGKVLVIDANPSILFTIQWVVGSADYEVLTAPDGESGLQQFSQGHPDLVILDIMLPRLDGWEVCRRIRSVSQVPIIIHTALQSADYRLQAVNAGACDYLVKPVLPKAIRNQVELRLKSQEPYEPPGPQWLPGSSSPEPDMVAYT
jgi:OmpR family response regulator RpaB